MAGTVPLLKSPSLRKSQSSQGQQFRDRQQIAERPVQHLRKAGYSCGQVDGGRARVFKHDD